MARSVPTPAKLKQIHLDILRSIYYKQELPRSVFSDGASWVQAANTVLLQSNLIAVVDTKYALTELGFVALKKMAGGHIPKMIRMDKEIFTDKKDNEKFIVDRSLAREIFREVSADG